MIKNDIEKEIESQLNIQKITALKYINDVKSKLKPSLAGYQVYIYYIDKMIRYVNRYKWLPDSYSDMLDDMIDIINKGRN